MSYTNCAKKIRQRIIAIFEIVICLMLLCACAEKESTNDVADYEKYFGVNGIRAGQYLVNLDIFPYKLPKTAEVERFSYNYYNPFDPCYTNVLSYTCQSEDYQAEVDRLNSLGFPIQTDVYGIESFPYEVCAVDGSDYGVVYAMKDDSSNKLIYVEITFCNGFSDMKYENIVPQEYLPIGFNAKLDK